MISSLLVANRGEIARRIFRSAEQMGIRCVAVFADADADAPFVREADVAVRLPGSYLDGDAIIAAAVRTGAEAIHPGYGFLSENAAFARAVTASGLIWVGPTPDVIDSMGDKIAAKRVAVDAGVPTLPSSEDPTADSEVGYPLLVKASAGGGGKGMRIVESPDDLTESVAAAQREAKSGFGDDRVFLERYVARSRHVEIQILGDSHGNLVHLGERECSIQRRHQKILEESPSPVVDQGMRTAMGDSALALARAMGYRSAGTVEFLVDDDTREFFFLEVNTRLQVEHPVTEEVTGIDLVREQLRVAAGEKLGYDQSAISWSGHAVEARLYAEDPDNGFLPATGTVTDFDPAIEPQVRWEKGVERGSVIGVDFDPMLAKVIAHAPTRSEAAGKLALALERLDLAGVVTNRDFLAATLRDGAFLAGDTTTDYIERIMPGRPLTDHEVHRACVAAALWLQAENRRNDAVWGFAPSNWRNAGLPAETISFTATGEEEARTIGYRRRRDGSWTLESGEHVVVHDVGAVHIDLEIDGLRSLVRVVRDGDVAYIHAGGRTTLRLGIEPRFDVPGSDLPAGGLVAPMPGVVLDVRCAPGDPVSAGDVLIVLEAMKMEHHIAAPADGTVTEVPITAGQQVENGALLVTLDDGSSTDSEEAS